MIALSQISVSFAQQELFSGVSFNINRKDRIALVGKNGTGKTTLMNIIAGCREPTSGSVVRKENTRCGYLPQHMHHAKNKTVLEETLTVLAEMDQLSERIEQIHTKLSQEEVHHTETYGKLLTELTQLNDRYRMYSSENPVGRAEKILLGLGFKREDLEKPTAVFSEGWNMRIELAKLLLSNPDVLLLDEPTNHLDIESLRWLEEYLSTYAGALLVVSHDRTFLDTVTNRTIELSVGKIYDYKVSYSPFMVLRQERIAQQTAAYENQQKTIEKTKEFIDRFRYKPTKSNQVQSRIKQLEKMELVEIDPVDHTHIHIRFPDPPRSGRVVYRCKEITAGYEGKPVFEKASLVLERGEKIAFVGRNGEGKTTLLKLLAATNGAYAAQPQILDGTLTKGHLVHSGYYAQNQDELLNKDLTVFQTVDEIAVGDITTKLRDLLGAFLFRGDDIDKKTIVLSGGERARLAMAALMLQPYNVLLLDEPTNHMDIPSKEILKKALLQYTGTVIIVSHDRTFLHGLVDKVYEFRDGKVKEHLGGITAFLERRKMETGEETTGDDKKPDEQKVSDAALEYKKKKERERTLRQLKSRVTKWENEIEAHERKIAEWDTQWNERMEEGFDETFLSQYEKEKQALEKALTEWETAHNLLDIFIKTGNHE
ncbi:MAG: ABC-F family ATP-binding cassette domain-containing protein [Bacteroidales bacterium]